MKGWMDFLLVGFGVLYLLSLGSQAPLSCPHPEDRYANCLEREPAPNLPPAWIEDPTAFQDTAATLVTAPKESVVLDCALTRGTTGPPLRGLHGPPGTRKDLGPLWAQAVTPSVSDTPNPS